MNDNVSIEDLIPHRDGMKLVEEILDCEANRGATAATVSGSWPMASGGSVSSIVFIELAAQTAGVVIGLDEFKKTGKKMMGKGWIVGIKSADFSVDRVPIGSRIITESVKLRMGESYTEIEGRSMIGGEVVGRVVLQAFRSD